MTRGTQGSGPALVLVAALLAAGCVERDDRAGPGRSAGGPTAGVISRTDGPTPGRRTCTSHVDGYQVELPEGWHVVPAPEPCRWLHPRPIDLDLDEGEELTAVAVRLAVVSPALEEVQRIEQGRAAEVLGSERRTVDGRAAVRQQLRASGEAALPPGTLVTQWLVDLGGRTLIATTSQAAADGTYEGNVAALDHLVLSMRRVEPGEAACSAEGAPAELEPQPGLPSAVARTRQEIHAAASRCDFERLAEVVPERGFTYDFAGGDDPIGSWRRAEQRGAEPAPMRYLAGLLQRPYGSREVQGETQYEWPSAFSYDRWRDVPQEDRRALQPLYGQDDFEQFERFGGYVGYRVVIAGDGTWTAFVAGD